MSRRDKESWRDMLTNVMSANGETWNDVVSCTATTEELDVMFDSGFGCENGIPFTLWTGTRVYFPTSYDGAESVRSVARFPDGIPTGHV